MTVAAAAAAVGVEGVAVLAAAAVAAVAAVAAAAAEVGVECRSWLCVWVWGVGMRVSTHIT